MSGPAGGRRTGLGWKWDNWEQLGAFLGCSLGASPGGVLSPARPSWDSPSIWVPGLTPWRFWGSAGFWPQLFLRQQRQAPAQPCGGRTGHPRNHSPITPKPPPVPTCSLLLQLLCLGPDFGHVVFVGFQQLRCPRVPLWQGRLLAGLSLRHRGRQWAQGRSPTGLGTKLGTKPAPRVGELTSFFSLLAGGCWGLRTRGSVARSRALSRGVRMSPRGAPRACPGPRGPNIAGGSPESRRRWRCSARSPCWGIPTSGR